MLVCLLACTFCSAYGRCSLVLQFLVQQHGVLFVAKWHASRVRGYRMHACIDMFGSRLRHACCSPPSYSPQSPHILCATPHTFQHACLETRTCMLTPQILCVPLDLAAG